MKQLSIGRRALTSSLILLGLSSLVAFATISLEDSITEPESGVQFALSLEGKALCKDFTLPITQQALDLADQVLMGVGVREKTIFGVDVYAMGLYVAPKRAKDKLAKWQGKTAKELQSDSAFYDVLLKDPMPTTLRLVMCRDVDGDDMAEAFEDSLAPRMKGIIAADSKAGSMEDLKSFRSFFDIDEVKDGVEMLFTWDTEGTLYTRVQGKPLGAIASPALCRSLFDIYLGGKPISKSAKKSLVARFPELLKVSETTR
jgi:hypothetical protein